MRSLLLFFCLVAAVAAADQKADSSLSEAPSEPVNGLPQADSVPTGSQPVPIPLLLTYDELNAMTNEQRTAYANAFDQTQAQSNVDNSYVRVARADTGFKNGYKSGESSYKSVDNGYISDITGFNRGNSRSDRGYSSTNTAASYSSKSYESGNGYKNDGKAWIGRSGNGYGRGEIGSRSGENGFKRGEEDKDENTKSGPYAYGYDNGHKSARGYSDSLPKDYPYRIKGLHGFVFEKRYSRASGLMNPIAPEALSHIGYRQMKNDEIFVPPY